MPGTRGETPDRLGHGPWIAALQAVREDQHDGAARGAGKAGHGQESLQGVADARAAVPVGDEARGGAERLLAVPELQRPRHARQPRADGEHLDMAGCPDQSMSETKMRIRARLHGARHVDEEQNGASARLASQARQAKDLAVVADHLLHRPPQIEPGPTPGPEAPISAPLRQMLGQSALKAPQRSRTRLRARNGAGEGLGRRRGLASLVDLVGGRRLEAAAAVLLHPQLLRFGLGGLAGELDRAQKVRIEQRVELLAPFRRRRQRRMRGAADVVEAARAQHRDGRQEGRGLLGRHRQAVGAQERSESDEWLGGTRQNCTGHAAAPVMMASSRGAMCV